MMSLWDALRMNMMISYQELVRTFLSYERFGFAQSYLIMGIMVFSTTFISIFLLRSTKSSSEPSFLQQKAV